MPSWDVPRSTSIPPQRPPGLSTKIVAGGRNSFRPLSPHGALETLEHTVGHPLRSLGLQTDPDVHTHLGALPQFRIRPGNPDTKALLDLRREDPCVEVALSTHVPGNQIARHP